MQHWYHGSDYNEKSIKNDGDFLVYVRTVKIYFRIILFLSFNSFKKGLLYGIYENTYQINYKLCCSGGIFDIKEYDDKVIKN